MAGTAPDYDNQRYGGPDGIRYPGELGKTVFLTAKNPTGKTTYYTAAGAIPVESGTAVLNGSGALAMTLALPVAGAVAAGGQDGIVLTIVALTAHAHTVTTPADGIWGSKDTVTYAAEGDVVILQAVNGVWMAKVLGGPTPAALSEV